MMSVIMSIVRTKRSVNMDKQSKASQIINVKKSNSLIESIGKTTLLSNKVFLTALLKIENRNGVPEAERAYYKRIEDISGTDYTHGMVAEFRNSDLRSIMKSKSGSYYSQIAELLDPTSKKSLARQWTILIKDPESQLYGATDVITSTLYDDKNGKLFIKFSSEPKVQATLVDLRGNYTLLDYELMMSFKSIYSYRIYELLLDRIGKEDAHHPKKDEYAFRYGLSQLKYLLGILDPYINKDVKNALTSPYPDYEKIEEMISTEHVMPRYNDFKKYTLVKAKKEIDELTDYVFEFEPVRNGRGGKVVAVDLVLRRKRAIEAKSNVELLTDEQKDDILDACFDLFKEPLRMKDMRTICEAAEYNYEKIEKAYHVMESSSSNISNVVGFMVKAIKEDYDIPVTASRKKSTFSNFHQRDYDYDELEKIFITTTPQSN